MKNKIRFLGLFFATIFTLSAFAGCNNVVPAPFKSLLSPLSQRTLERKSRNTQGGASYPRVR